MRLVAYVINLKLVWQPLYISCHPLWCSLSFHNDTETLAGIVSRRFVHIYIYIAYRLHRLVHPILTMPASTADAQGEWGGGEVYGCASHVLHPISSYSIYIGTLGTTRLLYISPLPFSLPFRGLFIAIYYVCIAVTLSRTWRPLP